MVIVWRALVMVSLMLIGLASGTWIGGQFFVPKGSGLAGAPMALGYGVLGAFILLVVGILISLKLKGTALRNVSLSITSFMVIIFGTLTIRFVLDEWSEREPDNAFNAAGQFTATMERLDKSDPYLFIELQVDAQTRSWTQTGPAPQNQICTAKMNATSLTNIRMALDKLSLMSAGDFEACRNATGPVIKRISWDLMDAQTPQTGQNFSPNGSLDIRSTCLQNNTVVARALILLESASRTSSSKVECD